MEKITTTVFFRVHKANSLGSAEARCNITKFDEGIFENPNIQYIFEVILMFGKNHGGILVTFADSLDNAADLIEEYYTNYKRLTNPKRNDDSPSVKDAKRYISDVDIAYICDDSRIRIYKRKIGEFWGECYDKDKKVIDIPFSQIPEIHQYIKELNMNALERKKMVVAMEYIAKCTNNEEILDKWLMCGVPDGEIPAGSLDPENVSDDLIDNDTLKDFMTTFTSVMASAKKNGGICCDGIVSD